MSTTVSSEKNITATAKKATVILCHSKSTQYSKTMNLTHPSIDKFKFQRYSIYNNISLSFLPNKLVINFPSHAIPLKDPK